MPEEDDWGCFSQREGLRLRPKGRTEPGLLSPSWEAVGSDCSAARRSEGEMGRGQNTDKPEGKGPAHQGAPKKLVHTAAESSCLRPTEQSPGWLSSTAPPNARLPPAPPHTKECCSLYAQVPSPQIQIPPSENAQFKTLILTIPEGLAL